LRTLELEGIIIAAAEVLVQAEIENSSKRDI
jgi:hypothetical protein